MEDSKRSMERINKLKIIACILIVLGHSTAIYTGNWVFKTEQSSLLWKSISIYVSSFHLILFIFSSGFIYSYCKKKKEKYKSLKELIRIKFKRLMIPYLLVGSLFMIPIGMVLNIERYRNPYIVNLRSFLIGRSNGHLWFLMMLFMLFIVFYFLEKIFINKDSYKEKLLIFLMIIANIISSRIPDYFEISNVCYYCIYFYIGYKSYIVLEKRYDIFNTYIDKNKYVYFMNTFIIIIVLIYICRRMDYYFILTSIVQKILYFIIGILGVIHIYIFTFLIEKKFIINKIIEFIGKYIFNIYLLHEPIIFIILSKIKEDSLNPTMVSCTLIILSIIVSILLSEMYYIVKRVKKRMLSTS